MNRSLCGRTAQTAAVVFLLAVPALADWHVTDVRTDSLPRGVAVNPVTNRVYTTNDPANTVTEIDGATMATTAIAVGAGPRSIAVNPVTNKVYVANQGGSTVTVIDGATRTTTTVTVGSAPGPIAVNPVTNRIYVGLTGATTVVEINGATNATTAIPVASAVADIAVNALVNKVYAACVSANKVAIIDGVTRNVTTRGCYLVNCVAVNHALNRTYAAPGSGAMLELDGATNDSALMLSVGTFNPKCMAVNPATGKLYLAMYDNDIEVVDCAGRDVDTIIQVGTWVTDVAVNPVTNKVYVIDEQGSNLIVVDGATNAVEQVSIGAYWPTSVGSNPLASKQYVGELFRNRAAVDDGSHYTSTAVAVGTNPAAAAVNRSTNRIYVANQGGNNVTVIDGATNGTTTVPAGTAPRAVAVNPSINKIYVANQGGNNVTVIDGATNGTVTVAAGTAPCAVAVNTGTSKAFVADSAAGQVTVIDGASNGTRTVTVGAGPRALAVNPATNKIYVANSAGNTVTVINGANLSTATVTVGTRPWAVDVNSRTNNIYVTNRGSNTVTVIDGATNGTTSVAAFTEPMGVSVNTVTNKVYVGHNTGLWTLVIDGATNGRDSVPIPGNLPVANPVTDQLLTAHTLGVLALADISSGASATLYIEGSSYPTALVTNPVTGLSYLVCSGFNNVLVWTRHPEADTKVRVVVSPLPNDTTALSQPAITGRGVNRMSPNRTPMLGVIGQTGTARSAWHWNSTTRGAGTDSIHWSYMWGTDSLAYGENLICLAGLEADGASTGNLGDASPYTGNLAVYPVTRLPYYRDVLPTSIVLPASIDSGTALAPACSVYNCGMTMATYTVRIRIGSFYNRTSNVTSQPPGDRRQVTTASYSTWPRGTWPVTCSTELSGDNWVYNDRLACSLLVNVKDVALDSITVPRGVLDSGAVVTPACRLQNYGTTTIPNYTVRMKIGSGYNQTSTLYNHAPGTVRGLTFPSWTANELGGLAVSCSTQLSGDIVNANDKMVRSVNVRVRDAGVRTIVAPSGYIDSGAVVAPEVRVRNYGSEQENFPVWFEIHSGSALPFAAGVDQDYVDSTSVTLAPGESTLVQFRDWTAEVPDTYALVSFTDLAGDRNPANDTARGTVIVGRPVHDVAALAILAPVGQIDSGTVTQPSAVVRNYGPYQETFLVRLTIGAFFASETTVTLGAGLTDTAAFRPWRADSLGTLAVRCSTMLAGDQNPANDLCRDSVTVMPMVGVEEPGPLPLEFALAPPRPNPFTGRTLVRYAVPRGTGVSVAVYSAAGRLVSTLTQGRHRPGWFEVVWNGCDRLGRPLVRGVYYCRLETTGFTATRKLVLQR